MIYSSNEPTVRFSLYFFKEMFFKKTFISLYSILLPEKSNTNLFVKAKRVISWSYSQDIKWSCCSPVENQALETMYQGKAHLFPVLSGVIPKPYLCRMMRIIRMTPEPFCTNTQKVIQALILKLSV